MEQVSSKWNILFRDDGCRRMRIDSALGNVADGTASSYRGELRIMIRHGNGSYRTSTTQLEVIT